MLTPQYLYIFQVGINCKCRQPCTLCLRDHKRFELRDGLYYCYYSFVPNVVASYVYCSNVAHVAPNQLTTKTRYFVISNLKLFYILEWAYRWHFPKQIQVCDIFITELKGFRPTFYRHIFPTVCLSRYLVNLLRIRYVWLRSFQFYLGNRFLGNTGKG